MKMQEERLQSILNPSIPHLETAITQVTICSTALPFRASITKQPMTPSTIQGKRMPRPARESYQQLFQPTLTQRSKGEPRRVEHIRSEEHTSELQSQSNLV